MIVQIIVTRPPITVIQTGYWRVVRPRFTLFTLNKWKARNKNNNSVNTCVLERFSAMARIRLTTVFRSRPGLVSAFFASDVLLAFRLFPISVVVGSIKKYTFFYSFRIKKKNRTNIIYTTHKICVTCYDLRPNICAFLLRPFSAICVVHVHISSLYQVGIGRYISSRSSLLLPI